MAPAKNRVVLDTNIYISALVFSGICEEIIECAREGYFELLISPPILLELGTVLQDKFGFTKREALYAISEIKRIAEIIVPKIIIKAIKEDDADNRVLECAVDGAADYVVSGDKKHLCSLKEYKGIKIILPSEFIKV